MKFINNIIKKTIQKFTKPVLGTDVKPLGRWNIDYCDNKINKKVDLSNEDHCGPCGNQSMLQSSREIKK